MTENEKQQRMEELAREILQLSRSTLLVNLRFLDKALSQFTLIPKKGMLAADDQHIYYDAWRVLQRYRTFKEQPVRDYLHMVLHCVFRHSFVNTLNRKACWDLACDMAAENIINELELPCVNIRLRQEKQAEVLAPLKAELRYLTAEKIYHYYQEKNLSDAQLQAYRKLFEADDHDIWYSSGLGNMIIDTGHSWNSYHLQNPIWKRIAEEIKEDLLSFSQKRGTKAGSLIQNLQAVTRERYDYRAFLRKFAVMGEAMKVNDEEFDYIFYTYGMQLFGNMPLIEPLEYKEVKRIREFVLAIDTSGSVSGELVQQFVQKTYNILKQEESFFTKINLHIIQCDAELQEDVKITSQKDFDQYISHMQLRGFGGTDFRPVFSYVETLREAGEFTNLKGLIYFTDGYGVFPKRKPDYHTAFIFIGDECTQPRVPDWAIRLVLESTDITGLQI